MTNSNLWFSISSTTGTSIFGGSPAPAFGQQYVLLLQMHNAPIVLCSLFLDAFLLFACTFLSQGAVKRFWVQ
jgi:hypothetical protein